MGARGAGVGDYKSASVSGARPVQELAHRAGF
jgi:hypothetical protein